MAGIYAIGETVFDIIFSGDKPVNAVPGGSMLNAAVSLGRSGMNVEFISEFGNDPAGRIISDFLHENHVAANYTFRYALENTSIALAFLDEDKKAAYTFYHNRPELIPEPAVPPFKRDDICLFGSFYSIKPERAKLVNTLTESAFAGRSFILYDPNIRKPHAAELPKLFAVIEKNFSLASVVKGSDEDFCLLFNLTDPAEIYAKISKYCPVLILTRGSDGAILFTPGFAKEYPVPKINPVSTIGAGDNFNAGLACGLIQTHQSGSRADAISRSDWDQIIDTAIQFATATCLSFENYIPLTFALSKNETY
jgi:fructokinase